MSHDLSPPAYVWRWPARTRWRRPAWALLASHPKRRAENLAAIQRVHDAALRATSHRYGLPGPTG